MCRCTDMKPIRWHLTISTLFVIFYMFVVGIDPMWKIAFVMFLVFPIILIWLVLGVLKKGEPSERTLEDGFYYDDSDIQEKDPL